MSKPTEYEEVETSPTEFLDKEKFESDDDEAMEKKENTDKDAKIFKRYLEREKAHATFWGPIFDEAKKDWKVYRLDQWTEDAKKARQRRVMLTSDTGRKFVKASIAEIVKTPPAVKLTARDDGASFKANVMGDAIRFFADRCGEKYAVTWAAECAAVGGFGWLRKDYKYDEHMAMPGVIMTCKVLDPFSITIDPDCDDLAGRGAIDAIERHGKTKRSKTGKEHQEKVTFWYTDPDPDGERDDSVIVKWAVIEGDNVESKGIWPGCYIPIISVYGEYSKIDGETVIMGLIRQLRDNIRAYNYILSEGVERLAMTGKTTVMADERAIPEKYMGDYQRRASDPVSVLLRVGVDSAGNPIEKPEIINTTPDVAWLPQMLSQILGNEKESVGIYDTALGAQDSPQESGLAIKSKQMASDRGQLVYSEHLQISMNYVGEQDLELMQHVVGPGGKVPTLSEDGKPGVVPIGPGAIDPLTGAPVPLAPGAKPTHIPDLDPRDLDISVSSAPAYSTRKEEGLDRMESLLNGTPELKAQTMDLVIRQMDFPGSKDIADRLYKALPPNLQDQPQGGASDPAAMAQQMQQMQQQLAQAQQQAQAAAQQVQQLTLELQQNTQATLQGKTIEAQSRITVAQINANAGNALEVEKIASAERIALAKIEADARKHDAETEMQLAENKAKALGAVVVAHPGAMISKSAAPAPQAAQPPYMPPQATANPQENNLPYNS